MVDPMIDEASAAAYREAGWWSDQTYSDTVRHHASTRPEAEAWVTSTERTTWAGVDLAADRLASVLIGAGVDPGDRVAVWMGDTAMVHVAFLAVERAGATVVGLGARAGRREVFHLLDRTRATLVITAPEHRGEPASTVIDAYRETGASIRHLSVSGPIDDFTTTLDGTTGPTATGPQPTGPTTTDPDVHTAERRIGADDLFLINSTSGTTGLPKCVLHTQNRWRYFHTKAVSNGDLTSDDVFLSVVPAPFGFGLWTAHVTPILLGLRTVLLERFDPVAAFEAIERERATVLCCVSTQFIMMLAAPEMADYDLSSLRVTFTGGEAVPYERALEFERATGATILQFYGSNETGLLSGTTLSDPPERRLRTAGRIAPEMHVRLFEGFDDVTSTGRGQPACKGPALSLGYLDDDAANAQLYTSDGWMLMGDICEIDADGYLSVVGRTSDFIIRGGKNISAAQVESDVATHPAVAHVAAVAMPDPVFGERVCAYVELVDGASLDLDGLLDHLGSAGVSKELFPERLVVMDQLPRSSGAKVAKGELRQDAKQRAERGDDAPTTMVTTTTTTATGSQRGAN